MPESSSAAAPALSGCASPSAPNAPDPEPAPDRSIHGRLKRLLNYLGEQLKDVDPRGIRIDAGEFIARPGDFTELPGIRLDAKTEGDHVWLRVERLIADRPPAVPEAQQGIIQSSSDPDGPEPRLNEAAFKVKLAKAGEGLPEEARRRLEERSRTQLDQALAAYQGLWKSWAEGERPRRRTMKLYASLFSLKHAIEAEETARPTELVWGVGVLSWQLNDARGRIDYLYPLLTHALEIEIDDRTMAIEVRPRAVPTRVELEALIQCGVPGAAEVERTLREQLQRVERAQASPFDPASYADLARLVATNLDNEGRFLEVLARQEAVPSAGPHLVVTDAWVVFSRPRTRSVLIEDLVRLERAVLETETLPPGPAAIVTPAASTPARADRVLFRGVSSRGGGANCQELYFPLPYNDEQVTVVERLERSAGVTVQGPPGTGKTHTIANIICHYLATGRRVLVTSKGEPALTVLRDKLPEEVRPLAVALLTNDRESLRQFQGAIEAIQHRVSQLSERIVERDIATHHQSLDRAHAELLHIDRRVDEIALAQLSEVELDGERVRPQKAAKLVVEGEQEFGWFDDRVDPSPENAPPLSLEEAKAFLEARRRVGRDLKYFQADLPNPIEFPSAEAIGELHETLCRLKDLRRRERSGALLALKRGGSEVLVAARTFLELIERALGQIAELERTAAPWGPELRRKLREEAWRAEREALAALLRALEPFREARARFLQNPVDVPEEALGCEKTREAVRRAAETGKPFGLLAINAGRAKTLIPAIRIAGLPPKTPEMWRHVDRYLQLHIELRSFSVRWNHCAGELGIPSIAATPEALRGIEALGHAVQAAYALAVEIDPQLTAHAVQIFDKPPLEKVLGHAADLAVIRECLQDHLTSAELARSANAVSVLQEKLAGRTGEITERLREFVAGLGREGVRREDIVRHYVELLGELRRIVGLSGDLLTIRDFTSRIEAAGAPHFAERLRSMPVSSAGDDPALPARWREAWRWARLRGFLESIEGADELRRLAAERSQGEFKLEKLYREVVSQSAWLAIKRAASPHVMQALSQYATAVRKIGKGTGPNAIRYRRDAQEAMLAAAEAIPCWIMSHYKVSETMPAHLGSFDLVIVDEASQSDLTAIPAILRAKRVLVVGDDKQVSPTGGFIDSQRIQELLDRFLTDQPYRTELTPEKSLYDLAGRAYAAEQIMLREHFRCVPAIIAYSNYLFYSGAIAPLRIPKASERLDPPLVDIYVPEGVRDRRDRNLAEAEAIAAEIEAILAAPRFEGRSLGVISLLGPEQAKCIDEVVRERCDGAELHRRHFECGDASTFQGSERDVMFLSLVVDRSNCHALSGMVYDQRFNVAASRARDRMYLIRSVELAELSEKDLRRSLLEHFRKPRVADERETEELVERCESGFEREVFEALVARGYRVTPQVRTGAYRIDLVVDGEDDLRLAVECDGDEFHRPERWDDDTRRQRVLERAGWTFWRCFASTWTLRRKVVIGELVEKLSAMGIEPLGSVERLPSLVEARTWMRPAEADALENT